MIDSHCHIDLDIFDLDRDKVLKEASEVGIERMLVLGLSNLQFARLLKLKVQYSQLDIALGLHPYFLVEQDATKTQVMLNQFLNLAEQHKNEYIAFGEMGLDGSLSISMDYQQQILEFQLNVANDFRKPIVLHHRQSHNQLIASLKHNKCNVGGIIHAFSGSYQEALTYIDMGFLIGVGGTITYPRASKTRDTISKLPIDKLVLETDSPDMPINGYQGQRNEPRKLCCVVDSLSELRSESKAEIMEQTTKNYFTLFGLSEN